jgi:hypothetical protein
MPAFLRYPQPIITHFLDRNGAYRKDRDPLPENVEAI